MTFEIVNDIEANNTRTKRLTMVSEVLSTGTDAYLDELKAQLLIRPCIVTMICQSTIDDWFWQSIYYVMESVVSRSGAAQVQSFMTGERITVEVFYPDSLDITPFGSPTEDYSVNWRMHPSTEESLGSRIIVTPTIRSCAGLPSSDMLLDSIQGQVSF